MKKTPIYNASVSVSDGALQVATSTSLTVSGGGGLGEDPYWYEAKMCTNVQNYRCQNEVYIFDSCNFIYSSVTFNNIPTSYDYAVKWYYYLPNNQSYESNYVQIPGGYSSYNASYPLFAGCNTLSGEWRLKIVAKRYDANSHILLEEYHEFKDFVVNYKLLDHTMTNNLSNNYPTDRDYTFTLTDSKAIAWLQLGSLAKTIRVEFKWYYEETEELKYTSQANTSSGNRLSSTLDGSFLNNIGNWRVDVFINNSFTPIYSEYFVVEDNDNILDSWEIQYFGNLSRDGSGDCDGDGLTDLQEFNSGTNPTLNDTDQDTLNDGWEVTNSLNPISTDTDNDGMPDGWEILSDNIINDANKPLVVAWWNTFGLASSNFYRPMQQTSNGGYIVVGNTTSSETGYNNTYLLKIDSSGNKEWSKEFEIYRYRYHVTYSIQQTSDDGFIMAGVVGFSKTSPNSWNIYLLKTDELGNKEWLKILSGSKKDRAYSVQQTSDGGYILAGDTMSYGAGSSDIYLIKTDSLGNEMWSKTFGDVSWDYAYSVQQTSDGGYIITGTSWSYGPIGSNVYLIKTDSYGNKEWLKIFVSGQAHSVQQTSDGGYILAGSSENNVYILKTDSFGNEEWSRAFGVSEGGVGAYSVLQTSDGGYIAAGSSSSCIGGGDVYLIKIESSGNEEWVRKLGGADREMAYSVQQTSDDGYIVAGSTSPCISYYECEWWDFLLIKLAPSLSCFEGDINSDNRINILDVIKAFNIASNRYPRPSSVLEWCRSDPDKNSQVNILDVIRILDMTIGLE